MAEALSLMNEYLYILEDDRNKKPEEQTRWYFKPLSYEVCCQIEDSSIEYKSSAIRGSKDAHIQGRLLSGTVERKILQEGLVRVENFKCNGEIIELPDKSKGYKERDRFFARIRPKWRKELANAIYEGIYLSEEEEKNSS